MPGHNAFQRNAFQRNAFQIVYNFAPVVQGGIIGGGSVVCSFHGGQHHPTVEGGIIVGDAVRARFTPGQRQRRGSPGRVFREIFRRKRHYKPLVVGGVVIGGDVDVEFYPLPVPVAPEVLPADYPARVRGGLALGGSVRASFYSGPEPVVTLAEKDTRRPLFPPRPTHYRVKVGIREEIPIIAGGVKARFTSSPPPPRRIPYFSKLRRQIREEDEMLLMGLFDD